MDTSNLSERKRELLLLRLKNGAVKAASSGQPAPAMLPCADRNKPHPLSWAQQRLWFLSRLDAAATAAYHLPGAFRLRGKFDKVAFSAALNRIAARHESLRTHIGMHNGEPVQIVSNGDRGIALKETDLRNLTHEEREQALEQAIAAEAVAPFDLSLGPLMRVTVLQLAGNEHALLVTQHHIISDGWSLAVLVRELACLYRAFVRGEPDPLPPVPLQYGDYAAWQRQHLQGDTLKRQLDFWRTHLQGAPHLLELPLDRPRPAVQSYAGAGLAFTISEPLSMTLRALCKRHGITLFMLALAGWSTLLARLSGQDDVVVGTPVSNRRRTEFEPLMGLFVNTLALRVQLHDDPDVATLLARVRAATLAAYEHQDLPFEQVVEALQPPRSMSHSPVFQAMLAMNNTSRAELALDGVQIEDISPARHAAHFDLSLALAESESGIEATLEYASDLFNEETASRMASQFQCLLAGMAACDGTRVSALPILTAADRARVLEEFNATDIAHPVGLIHELFERQAAQRPNAIAVLHEGHAVGYDELNRHANRLAHRLLVLGVRPDDRVALCLRRGPAMVAALLGILKAGAAYVPLDPDYPPERLAYMIKDSAPVALLSQNMQPGGFTAGLRVVDVDDAGIDACPDVNPDPTALGLRAQHLAYVIYTSGSTGTPKGVLIEHGNVVNFIHNHVALCGLAEGDRVLQFASLAFDSSVAEIFPTLGSGATLVLRPNDLRFPDAAFVAFLRDQQVSVADLPTAFWQQWAQTAAEPAMRPGPALRLVIVSGEKAEPRHLTSWLADPVLARVRWLNNYGPTESTVNASAIGYGAGAALPEQVLPIGRPLGNTRLYILDRRLQPVPIGVTGEIHVGGSGIARGYLNQPELTGERFTPDPFSRRTGARLYKSGDLGRWLPDGTIEYIGRNDFQIKLRGFRIEPGEIEARLVSWPGIREAVVLAREDQPGDKRLVAYLCAEDGAALPLADLRAHLAGHLAPYMVPQAFVVLPALPLTGNGKLDRHALPAPGADALAGQTYVAPEGRLEQGIAAIWQDLLGLERVGRDDNFFERGGHSLMAVQVVVRIGRTLGIATAVRELFVHPVLHEFAAALASNRAQVCSVGNLVPIRRGGTQEALFLIHPGEGEVGYVRDLLPHLPTDLPLYGLAADGFLPGEKPLRDIRQMAVRYMQAIRQSQPHGPYRLAGWSAGGTIAYEIACQLEAVGESASFLGMIDTHFGQSEFSDNLHAAEIEPSAQDLIRALAAAVPQTLDARAQARLATIAASADLDAMLTACQQVGMFPPEVDMATLHRHLGVRYAIYAALCRYVPTTVPTTPRAITLFAATDDCSGDLSLGWRHFIGERLHVVPVPGGHYTVMQATHIARLGVALQRALEGRAMASTVDVAEQSATC